MKGTPRKVWAILVAAGTGSRLAPFVDSRPKQFLPWRGVPLYWHSVRALARCSLVQGITIVTPADMAESDRNVMENLLQTENPGIPWIITAGGVQRQDSVRLGLGTVPADFPLVAVHDAARPFLRTELVWRLCEAVHEPWSGAIPGLEVVDTIRMTAGGCPEMAGGTLPRERLRAVQTPQIFETAALAQAHALAEISGMQATDDASLLESSGKKVRIVPGDVENVKITGPADLRLLKDEQQVTALPCNGFGYDAHRFGTGRPLKIGGIAIPCQYEIVAHSDGDVLLHALMDAILGCACLGDIGSHFPDSDPAYDGIASVILLDQVLTMAKNAGIVICHADLTLIAQKPVMRPYAREIKNNIARLLDIDPAHVNFKATTEERMGFTGRLEGIKACAMVSALRITDHGVRMDA